MKQIKLIVAVFTLPLYLIGCKGLEGMMTDEGNRAPYPPPYAIPYNKMQTNKKYNNNQMQESKVVTQKTSSPANSRTEQASQESVEVITPPTKKAQGPAVPLEAPSVSGSY